MKMVYTAALKMIDSIRAAFDDAMDIMNPVEPRDQPKARRQWQGAYQYGRL